MMRFTAHRGYTQQHNHNHLRYISTAFLTIPSLPFPLLFFFELSSFLFLFQEGGEGGGFHCFNPPPPNKKNKEKEGRGGSVLASPLRGGKKRQKGKS